ncbi:MAG: UDP-glucose 4-epimerase GalE, partial [Rikenellaceae bacterium]
AKLTGKEIIFEKVDCCDREALRSVYKKYSFSAVIHFAAYKAVGESVEKPLPYYENNLNSLINVMLLGKEFGVNNLVFSSSCTVYGQPDVLPATEMTPRKTAQSPYGKSKQMAEEIIEDTVFADKNFRAISLRYFNPIGAHPSLMLGEVPNGIPNNLLPYLTQTTIGIRECLSVFGDDYNTPDGSAVRDYIDVVDLAKAHVKAMEYLFTQKGTERCEYFNIGTGRGVSVLQLISVFEKVNHLKLNYKITPRRAGDIEAVWADASLAEEKLGWKADVSLEDTLRTVWKWEQKLNHK